MRRFYAALAVATMVATAYVPAAAGGGSGPGNNRPTDANAASISSDVAADVAVDLDVTPDGIQSDEYADVTGTITVEVRQVNDDPTGYLAETNDITAVEIRLSASMWFVPADELTVTVAGVDGDTCDDATPTWQVSGGTLTVKSFECADALDVSEDPVDHITEFDVTITEDNDADRIGQSAIVDDGTYDLELQYRTNGSRRAKSYTWRYTEADAVTIDAI